MATLRELKGRIGSVASSEKITGVMRMTSSAKMHKAEQMLKQLVPFRSQVETIIGNLLSADAAFSSPLLDEREVRNATVVVWGSDDGLCGAYNVNIFKQLMALLGTLRAELGDAAEIRIIPVGAKIAKAVGKLSMAGVSVATYENISAKSDDAAVREFTRSLVDSFLSGSTDRVELLYMNFKSVSRQSPRVDTLIPVTTEALGGDKDAASSRPYIFEPDVNTIFNKVLPMYILSVMQEVFCENRASEQAARVMAMQSANDNAKKLLDQLRLEYNKLRQQSITTELLDIVGGQVR
ncbi:MAG: ATP synthase F1 subunit gamma [Bacteroidales bacterium]|nr:ATP synthase F1 subunit gamma [Bacteroidales bacterium]MBD5258664.1 ATP synthase F1 subunit gamma [Barnesiella sp.]